MNKEYTILDDRVIVVDDKGNFKEMKDSAYLEKILVIENVIDSNQESDYEWFEEERKKST